jgi:ribose transport system ATP-binding protein
LVTAPGVLSLENVTKRFPGVVALDGVSLSLYPGEVHVLIGENGSGKSTLVKIISGVYQPDEGRIFHRGQQTEIESPRSAQQLGISTIYQEFTLANDLGVMENVFLGREPVRAGSRGLLVDRQVMRQRTLDLLRPLSVHIDPGLPVSQLGVAKKQIVEIVKALSLTGEAVLVMDEPTSTLSAQEITELFRVIRHAKSKGVSVLYISHRLEEVKEIGDRVTVLRDGRLAGSLLVADADIDILIRLMVGRTFTELFPKRDVPIGDKVLEVQHLTVPGKVDDVSFSLHSGEILGVFGLVGSGRTELVRALMGKETIQRGIIDLRGHRFLPRSVDHAIASGLGMLPEERRSQGILPSMTVAQNIALSALHKCAHGLTISGQSIRRAATPFIDNLRIRTPSPDTEVFRLSGGNQQKTVLARLLFADAHILLLDEPTRGIDVGAKREVYQLIRNLAAEGRAVLMISSELPEIIGMSDRVLVMSRGRVVTDLSRSQMDSESIMRAAFDVNLEPSPGTDRSDQPGPS